ncbi:methyltransferase [Nostoc sp. UHCC 0302]|uniref:methyltransferase n=1 Tax=Nostoc sp. UHCC 0302 TaxID=3134896 RepID=UPI00311C8D2A
MSNINHSEISHEIQPTEALLQMIVSPWVSRSIYVAAELGIADLLKDGSQSCGELAKVTGVDERSLYRLLRALASVGVFAESQPGCFELTPLAECLQSNRKDSLRGYAIKSGQVWDLQPWGHLLECIKTGKPVFENLFGVDIFEYLSEHPEAAKIYDQSMTSFSAKRIAAITAEYDFSAINTLVEVGGGRGSLLASILKANLTMKGVLCDVPHVIEGAKQLIAGEGLSQRCELVAGDFFESVPSGGDAYLLKHIIHDWDDERALQILQNCRRVMQPNTKLLVIEMVIPKGNEPFFGKLLDLQVMLNYPGGCERTEAEYQDLFEAAGFNLTNIVSTSTPLSVIEGVPAKSDRISVF